MVFCRPVSLCAGRTHRSNQTSAPEYIFLISALAGEKRFASTVAKRLESLVCVCVCVCVCVKRQWYDALCPASWQGALTHGDRRAGDTRDLSKFNIDNKVQSEWPIV